MKCHELSDSTERSGLRSCMAAKGHHSPAFEQGQVTSTSSSNLPNDAGPGGVGSSSTSPMLTYFTNPLSQQDTSRLLCPARPNRVSASSIWLTPTATNSVSLGLCFRFGEPIECTMILKRLNHSQIQAHTAAASDCPSPCDRLARRAKFRFTKTPNQWPISGHPVPVRGAVARRHERGMG